MAFSIFIAVQVIVSLGFVFYYTTTFTARENYLRQYESMRTVEVRLNSPLKQSAAETLPDKLAKNPVVSLENIKYTFTIKPGTAREKSLFFAYWKPGQYKSRVVGSPITSKDAVNCAAVLVEGGTPQTNSKTVRHRIGDRVTLGEISWKVVGTNRYSSEGNEIPYTTGLKHLTLTDLQLFVPAKATDNQKEQLGKYVESLLPESMVRVPKPLTQKVLGNMIIPYTAGLLIGLSALVNLLFIFQYMLESCRQDYFVYRVCGCGGRKMFLLLLTELTSLFTVCFAVGTLLFSALRRAYCSNPVFTGSSLRFSQILLIYLVSLILIAAVMVPYFLRYRRQAVNGGGAL